MPTNEERREVARRLRRLAGRNDGVVWSLVEKHLGLVADDRFLGSSVYTSASVLHVAGLIDPEPERTCHVDIHAEERGGRFVWVYTFSCGHEFDSYWYMHPIYCPFCGSKVVGE